MACGGGGYGLPLSSPTCFRAEAPSLLQDFLEAEIILPALSAAPAARPFLNKEGQTLWGGGLGWMSNSG